MTNDKQFSATALKWHSSHYFAQNPACLRMMKGKNRLPQDYKSFLAQTTATFQHVSDKTKRLSQPCKYLLQHPISAVETRLDCFPANGPTVLFGGKPPSVISLCRLLTVNFVCKLQQHFPVDNNNDIHYGGSEKFQQCRKHFLQYSKSTSERAQGQIWGRQTSSLPQEPSNLVTPLVVITAIWIAKLR